MYGEFDDEFVMEDPYSLELQLERLLIFSCKKSKPIKKNVHAFYACKHLLVHQKKALKR
ncbi:hypothetical protein ABIA69_004369 [Lysinibacillus parviboronicapiens]|uniref:Uncharacterized protein n=1 Tax=Lysinibacillus parviboronicapiens TaxID=436516 RepID=A0ABV2PQC9_9BACI